MKKFISLLTVVLLVSMSLFSCIDGDKAKEDIDKFLSFVEKEDYEGAKALFHPHCNINLEEEILSLEESEEVDFSKGIKIENYTSVSTASYDSRVDGALYETTAKITVDGKTAYFSVAFADNDSGYGIYDFSFEF